MAAESLDLLTLRNELAEILNTVTTVARRVYRPPIIYEPGGDGVIESADDEGGAVPGLKAFEGTVEKEIDVLDKFLDRNPGASSTSMSTNAPYFTSVWREVTAAFEVTAIGQTFRIQESGQSSRGGKRASNDRRAPSVKVDVVTDRGTTWVRVNTIKNNRLRAELNDIDGYAGEDSDGTNPEDTPGSDDNAPVNSLLRMASNLLAAAGTNPVPGTNQAPNVFLRLTRLVPDESDPRIGETIDALRNMGIGIWLGERQVDVQQTRLQGNDATPSALSPTLKLNLDLSLLVAIVSDITHAQLPATMEEAVNRFRPLVKRWKRGPETADDYPAWVLSGNNAPLGGAAAHSRSLTYQVEQEKRLGLFEELRRRLPASLQLNEGGPVSNFECYTTKEASTRLKGIVDKIGGPTERKRAEALTGLVGTSTADFYAESRFDASFLRGLVPLRAIDENAEDDANGLDEPSVSTFQSHLAQTCHALLVEMDLVATARQAGQEPGTNDFDDIDQQQITNQATSSNGASRKNSLDTKEKQTRKKDVTTNAISPALTRHTVRSMLLGAQAGMTTVTANKASVRAILREMKRQTSGLIRSRDGNVGVGGQEMLRASSSDPANLAAEGTLGILDDSGTSTVPVPSAAIWVVEPRSLAENMRADKVHVENVSDTSAVTFG
ncbi:hypothetical protein FRB97_007078 [Tulasnella sp. 331]|nr:hypothetical protein FRB97_007078 [Tulasnella sp. 331]KAG8877189.1 hypothetical protein FRB98_006838 [Tulasnella sp. 332]